jgi:hemerythrin-like domain-containing protein
MVCYNNYPYFKPTPLAMSVTKELMKEHQLILKYVDLMQRYAKFSAQWPDSPLMFDKAGLFIDFIHEFADTFHHAKEENSLFRYLETPGVLTHCNPIPQMFNEHEQARLYVRNMENALSSKNLQDLLQNTQQYAELLTQHIFKEDNILYPMAEQGLDNEHKASLLQEYAETEAQLNGPALWRTYETLCKELENVLNAQP